MAIVSLCLPDECAEVLLEPDSESGISIEVRSVFLNVAKPKEELWPSAIRVLAAHFMVLLRDSEDAEPSEVEDPDTAPIEVGGACGVCGQTGCRYKCPRCHSGSTVTGFGDSSICRDCDHTWSERDAPSPHARSNCKHCGLAMLPSGKGDGASEPGPLVCWTPGCGGEGGSRA